MTERKIYYRAESGQPPGPKKSEDGAPVERVARPGTRHVYLPSRFSPNPEDKVRITLPLEPWHGGDAK